MEDPRQEQDRGILSTSYVDLGSASAQIGFSVVGSGKKTENPDDKALCWSPGPVIQASAQVLQTLTKRAQDSESELTGSRPFSASFERCAASRELRGP